MDKEIIIFIKKLSLFLFVFLISLLFVALSFNYVTYNYSLSFKKDTLFNQFIKERNYHVRYLFLGDSHTRNGIYPKVINNDSFNYGIDGESFVENYFRLKSLLNRGIKIDSLILEVDESMIDDFNQFEKRVFLIRNHISLAELMRISNNKLLAFLNYYLGFFGRGFYFGLLLTKGEQLDQYGAVSVKKTLKENKLLQINLKSTSPKKVYYLLKIIDLAKKHNINVIFIKYPLYLNKTRTAYDIYLENLLKNETLLDYEALFKNRPDYFADATHLNTKGARVFSKILAIYLKKVIAVNQSPFHYKSEVLNNHTSVDPFLIFS